MTAATILHAGWVDQIQDELEPFGIERTDQEIDDAVQRYAEGVNERDGYSAGHDFIDWISGTPSSAIQAMSRADFIAEILDALDVTSEDEGRLYDQRPALVAAA